MVDIDLTLCASRLVEVQDFIEARVFVGARLTTVDENGRRRPEEREERRIEARVAGETQDGLIVFKQDKASAQLTVLAA